MRLTLEAAKKKKPETRSRRPLRKEDEMSWGHEVCLVTWHMCPGSGDGEVPGLGAKSLMGRTGGFALRALRREGSGMRPWGCGGRGVRNGRLWRLRAGSAIVRLFQNGRSLFTQGRIAEGAKLPLLLRASGCAKPGHLLLAGAQPPPIGIKLTLRP